MYIFFVIMKLLREAPSGGEKVLTSFGIPVKPPKGSAGWWYIVFTHFY